MNGKNKNFQQLVSIIKLGLSPKLLAEDFIISDIAFKVGELTFI